MQCPRTQLETGQQAEAAAPSTAQRNPLCPITLHEVLDLHTGQLHSLKASRSRPIYWSKSSSWVSSILPPGRADRECARSGGPHFHTRHSSHTADTRLALHWPLQHPPLAAQMSLPSFPLAPAETEGFLRLLFAKNKVQCPPPHFASFTPNILKI